LGPEWFFVVEGKVAKIRDGVGVDGGGWFKESIERRVGNEVDTLFWTDLWLGGVSVCEV